MLKKLRFTDRRVPGSISRTNCRKAHRVWKLHFINRIVPIFYRCKKLEVTPNFYTLHLWFSTFFSSRHSKVQKNLAAHLYLKNGKFDKKRIFFPKRKKRQSKEKEFGGTLGRSSRHTNVPRHNG
jgi:hypothetical protein